MKGAQWLSEGTKNLAGSDPKFMPQFHCLSNTVTETPLLQGSEADKSVHVCEVLGYKGDDQIQ